MKITLNYSLQGSDTRQMFQSEIIIEVKILKQDFSDIDDYFKYLVADDKNELKFEIKSMQGSIKFPKPLYSKDKLTGLEDYDLDFDYFGISGEILEETKKHIEIVYLKNI